MNKQSQSPFDDPCNEDVRISRRVAVSSSALMLLGLTAGSALGQEGPVTEAQKESIEKGRQRMQEMMDRGAEAADKEWLDKMDPQRRAFWEGIRNAGSIEERQKIMHDRHIQQTQANLNKELGVSAEEWAVIQPRIVAVLHLNQAPFGAGGTPAALRVAQALNELMVLLQNKEAKAEEIKAKLTALRSAREQARQELAKAQRSLRQVMTLRQEAMLVLHGLLD